MAKQRVSVEIPLSLAKLLIAEPEDIKDSVKYEEVQAVAKALLKLLLETVK